MRASTKIGWEHNDDAISTSGNCSRFLTMRRSLTAEFGVVTGGFLFEANLSAMLERHECESYCERRRSTSTCSECIWQVNSVFSLAVSSRTRKDGRFVASSLHRFSRPRLERGGTEQRSTLSRTVRSRLFGDKPPGSARSCECARPMRLDGNDITAGGSGPSFWSGGTNMCCRSGRAI